VSTFLTHCVRSQILTLKEDSGVSSIVTVQRNHELFRDIKADDPELFKNNINIQKDKNSNNNENNKGILVLELFKMPKPLKDIFGASRGEYGEYLKAAEVSKCHFILV
jgi:hypothetical protein